MPVDQEAEPPVKHHGFSIDDFVSEIGSDISGNYQQNVVNDVTIPNSSDLEAPHLDNDAFTEDISWFENDYAREPVQSSLMSPQRVTLVDEVTKVPQPFTATPITKTVDESDGYNDDNTNCTNTTTYLPSLDPKDSGSRSVVGLINTELVYKSLKLYYSIEDSLLHDTGPTIYTGTNADDFHTTKYDNRSYSDAAETESLVSSAKPEIDLTQFKSENRNRIRTPELTPRTEGTKYKPIHHCPECKKGFLKKSNMKVHLRTHSGEKPFKCETCYSAFRQKAHLLQHNKIHR